MQSSRQRSELRRIFANEIRVWSRREQTARRRERIGLIEKRMFTQTLVDGAANQHLQHCVKLRGGEWFRQKDYSAG